MMGLIGFFSFIGIAYFLSESRSHISWRVVIWGCCLQAFFSILVLGIPRLGLQGPLSFVFAAANKFAIQLLGYTSKGSEFVFGPLAKSDSLGFIFAFQVLPTLIFISSLMSVLYHIGIMQKVLNAIGKVMQVTMGTSGAESLASAANVFVGQTEAPLVVKPFILKMTRSELFSLMVGGMATIAGGVLAAYVGLLVSKIPDIAGHLLTASVLSAPAALVMAKIMVPEKNKPLTEGKIPKDFEKPTSINLIEAASNGAAEGLTLAFNVGAMLLAFIALIALANGLVSFFGETIGFSNWGQFLVTPGFNSSTLTLELIFSWLFFPFALLMGIPWSECFLAGSLLGEKLVFNEFVAYLHLTELSNQLSQRSLIILSYALCGFANFSSIAIQIGGIGGLAPSRKAELAQFGIRAVIGGTLAAFMTASLASLLIP